MNISASELKFTPKVLSTTNSITTERTKWNSLTSKESSGLNY